MAAGREQVHLSVDIEGIRARLSRLQAAAELMAARFELQQATWEPHDWGRSW